jgi:nicotinamide-nucleotide amidase
MFSVEIKTLAALLIDEARERSLRIATAESCTGGLVAAALVGIPGSSDVFERGFVTYSNRAKSEVLEVPGDLIADVGAVSEPVVRMMAEGALANSSTHLAVAVTGVAGPGGGTALKPVGLVHFATARVNGSIRHRVEHFKDMDRDQVRLASVETALEMLRERLAS